MGISSHDDNQRASEPEVTEKQPPQQVWRRVLQEILSDQTEVRRLVEKTNISSITLGRWADGTALPRKANLQSLVGKLRPLDRKQLLPLLQQASLLEEDRTEPLQDDSPEKIPAEFYDRVCMAVCSTSASLRAWSICQLVLRQCSVQLSQLTPESSLLVTLLTCTPPLDGYPVRSLRELAFVYVNLQGEESEVKLTTRFLLGAESLPGQTCKTLQVEIEQLGTSEHLTFQHFFPHQIKNVAAAPLLRSGRVGGCLLLMNDHGPLFSQIHLRLLQNYAALVALAFEDRLFYEQSEIRLELMPPPPYQTIASTVRQRTITLMRQSEAVSSQQQAEALAWHAIENEHIALARGSEREPHNTHIPDPADGHVTPHSHTISDASPHLFEKA